ncbi:MAG TPA: nucleotide-binding protein [Arachnia sp.]|nr:nucleotide-binding protein [Arachnia sp.]HMT85849.1 nucleotide-binding protein [Arachnia sp.]
MPDRQLSSLEGLFVQLAPDYFTRTGLENLLLTHGLTIPAPPQSDRQMLLQQTLDVARKKSYKDYELFLKNATDELARKIERKNQEPTRQESTFLKVARGSAISTEASPTPSTDIRRGTLLDRAGQTITSREAHHGKVFLVHGRSLATEAVARFVERIGYEPVLLKERPQQGRSILEKFLDEASDAVFAIILLTGDDEGGLRGGPSHPRARQNVVFEFGFFVSALGRSRTAALYEHGVELPTDLSGVGYVHFSLENDGWKVALAKEMKAGGLKIDMNTL